MSASRSRACERCLRRSWLLARLAGHLDAARGRIAEALALPDPELIDALAGRWRDTVTAEYAQVDATVEHERSTAAGLELICRCDPDYPARLQCLLAPPAVLHVAGGLGRFLELAANDPVAIVGARRASEYGLEVARWLGRGLAGADVPVLSGLASGIDSAAHHGALSAAGPAVAVLPGGADRPYPPGKRGLYKGIREVGAVISELPPGTQVRRWTFLARNRIIAALSAITVVVEAGERSGALLTAGHARELARPVGAVPGRITSSVAAGPNGLIKAGAELVSGPQDVLDLLFGNGMRQAPRRSRKALDAELARLLDAIGDGLDTIAALARAGLDAEHGLAALTALELAGYVRREAGGRYTVVP